MTVGWVGTGAVVVGGGLCRCGVVVGGWVLTVRVHDGPSPGPPTDLEMHMPQYPMLPWRWNELHLQRKTRLGVKNPRYADLPLVCGLADGTIEVLSGDPGLAESLTGTDEGPPAAVRARQPR